MNVILILKDKEGKISHHHPIPEKSLYNTERECIQHGKEVIYKLFIKTAFSIQRYEASNSDKNTRSEQE